MHAQNHAQNHALTPSFTSNITERHACHLEQSLDKTLTGRLSAYGVMMQSEADTLEEIKYDDLYLPESLLEIKRAIETQKRISEIMQAAVSRLESVNPRNVSSLADAVLLSEDQYLTIHEAGQLLEIGENRLYAFLRNHRWLTCCNKPYQNKITHGFLKLKIDRSKLIERGLKSSTTVVITGKGLSKLHDLIG